MKSKISLVIIVFGVLPIVSAGVFFAVRNWQFGIPQDPDEIITNTEIQRQYIPLTEWGMRTISSSRTVDGDLVVNSEVIIEDSDFLQRGNITVEGNGRLIFRDSLVALSGQDPIENSRITVKDKA